jgi:hypothetical protein
MESYSYITLSDFSTFDSDAYYVILSPEGQAQLESANDMKCVDVGNVELSIPIGDLIAAYNQLHGTNY